MSQLGKDLISALKCRYLSEIQYSKKELQLYMNTQVDVVEYLDKIDQLIENIIVNQNKLQTLRDELGETDNNLG